MAKHIQYRLKVDSKDSRVYSGEIREYFLEQRYIVDVPIGGTGYSSTTCENCGTHYVISSSDWFNNMKYTCSMCNNSYYSLNWSRYNREYTIIGEYIN